MTEKIKNVENAQLIFAIRKNDYKKTKDLIEKKSTRNAKDFIDSELFINAVKYASNNIITMLLKKHRFAKNGYVNSSIHYCCEENKIDTLRCILNNSNGHHVSFGTKFDYHSMVLVNSCKNNNNEIFDFIMKNEDINEFIDNKNNFPFRSAVKSGNLYMVKKLLQHEKVKPYDLNSRAIILSWEQGNKKMLNYLLTIDTIKKHLKIHDENIYQKIVVAEKIKDF